jgi:hypothetical protein
MSVRYSLEQRLRGAHYRDCREGVFEAPISRRVIALIEATSHPAQWSGTLDGALRHHAIRMAPNWARYAVLLVSSHKTPELATAAAAFCRDVSKCRRLVAFADQTAEDVLPFLGLSSVSGGGDTPVDDVEAIAQRILGSPELASAFLDAHTTVAQVQKVAEDSE